LIIAMPRNNNSAKIRGYHAHIYYSRLTRGVAEHLRRAIPRRFKVELGRWREEPVGPHPQSMYQVKFEVKEFQRIVPWLMLNRGGLSILVHPETGDGYQDHAFNALWLGDKLTLRLDIFGKLRPKTPWRRGRSGRKVTTKHRVVRRTSASA
jgi:aromatic ring-cleaving dioxygenase